MAAAASNELQYLPEHTQSKLRSTQIISSLPQVVSELIQNALDADASQIDVGVDCEEWTCWIRDDGKGMSKADLFAIETAGRYGRLTID
jgi:DNA mismatch repair protein MLH3